MFLKTNVWALGAPSPWPSRSASQCVVPFQRIMKPCERCTLSLLFSLIIYTTYVLLRVHIFVLRSQTMLLSFTVLLRKSIFRFFTIFIRIYFNVLFNNFYLVSLILSLVLERNNLKAVGDCRKTNKIFYLTLFLLRCMKSNAKYLHFF